jgi:hypothetical protein
MALFRRRTVWIIGILAASALGQTASWKWRESRGCLPVVDTGPTAVYICDFDPARYIRRGTDLANPDYTLAGSARRVGKAADKINGARDYDFARLAAVEKRLAGVDRRRALLAIFQKITATATTPREQHLAVLNFLQQASIHNIYIQPLYPDGTMVTDPLVLLELGEMRCGQVARVAVDLFDAAGYRGRLVQLASHVVAELFYDQDWHYLDADLISNGMTVLNPDGSIPSIAQLSRSPLLIDRLSTCYESPKANTIPVESYAYPSWTFCSRQAWEKMFPAGRPRRPFVYFKTATQEQARASRLYGWEWYAELETPERQLHDVPQYYAPGAPAIQQVEARRLADGSLRVVIAWAPSQDGDHDMTGYRVFVSRQSRGWNYAGNSLPYAIMPLKSSHAVWTPEMYARRCEMPKSEVLLAQTADTHQDLRLTAPGEYYVTVMPLDAHGEKAGHRFYSVSEELCVRNEPPEKRDIALAASRCRETRTRN